MFRPGISNVPVTGGGTTSYYNQALVLSYANYAGKWLSGLLRNEYNIHAGMNLKYYSKGYTGDVTANGAGANLDLGLKYYYDSRLTVGLDLQNILVGARVGGDFDPEVMPFVTRLGVGYNWKEYNVLFDLDKEFFFGRDIPWPMHFGVEWQAQQNLILRTGLDQYAGSSGSDDLTTNATFGIEHTIQRPEGEPGLCPELP